MHIALCNLSTTLCDLEFAWIFWIVPYVTLQMKKLTSSDKVYIVACSSSRDFLAVFHLSVFLIGDPLSRAVASSRALSSSRSHNHCLPKPLDPTGTRFCTSPASGGGALPVLLWRAKPSGRPSKCAEGREKNRISIIGGREDHAQSHAELTAVQSGSGLERWLPAENFEIFARRPFVRKDHLQSHLPAALGSSLLHARLEAPR